MDSVVHSARSPPQPDTLHPPPARRYRPLTKNAMSYMRMRVMGDYEKTMGPEFGSIYRGVMESWCVALLRHKEIQELFGESRDRTILNAVGGRFLVDVERVLWYDLLLWLCKLTDRAEMGKHKNLSIRTLYDYCAQPLQDRVCPLICAAKKSSQFARVWRDKHIAHSDLERYRNPTPEPLPPADAEMAKTALDDVACCLGCRLRVLRGRH